jgi:site-specific recombinase XerD
VSGNKEGILYGYNQKVSFSFFGWLLDEGFITRNPMRRIKLIKVPQRIKKPFTSAEREHL